MSQQKKLFRENNKIIRYCTKIKALPNDYDVKPLSFIDSQTKNLFYAQKGIYEVFGSKEELDGPELMNHPYFDLDIKKKHHPENFEELVKNKQKILDDAIEFIQKTLNINNPSKEESKYNNKISYHFIFPDYKIKYLELVNFVKDHEEEFKKYHLDPNAYHPNEQKFRMIRTSKKGKNSPLIPLNYNNNITKHLVTYLDGNEKEIKYESSQKIKKNVIKKKPIINIMDKVQGSQNNDVKNILNKCDKKVGTPSEIEEARILLKMLNKNRSEDYNDWLHIGYILHNTDLSLLNDWIEFSKISDKYKEGECIEKWNKAKTTGSLLRIGTLHMMAQKDNKIEYLKYISKSNIINFNKALSNTDNDIALIIYDLYKSKFTFVTNEKIKKWFYFDGNQWKENGEYYLKKLMSKELYDLFLILKNYYTELMVTEEDSGKKETYEKYIDQCLKVSKGLKTNVRKKAILGECEELFKYFDDKFEEKLDSNIYIIGFNNGVFDLKQKIFRQTEPEDLITYSVGYDYPEEDNEIIQKEIDEFFLDIFGKEDIVKYNYEILTYCLSGNRFREKFNIWVGNGRNGKGTSCKLIKNCFGNYYKEIDANLITDTTTKSGQANSELAQCKGKRIVVTTEPDGNLKLQTNRLKKWTGGDSIQARNLYCPNIEFTPQFHLIIQANFEPETSTFDKAYALRAELLQFPYQFVKDHDVKLNQKEIKYDIKSKFEENMEYARQLMRMLLKKYKDNYQNNNKYIISIPDAIKNSTDSYLDDNNIVFSWIKDKYDITQNKDDAIKSNDLFNDFKIDNPVIKMSASLFKQQVTSNNIIWKKTNKGNLFLGLKIKDIVVNDNEKD